MKINKAKNKYFQISLNYTYIWEKFNEVNNRVESYKIVRILVASEFSMIASPLQGASSLCECPYILSMHKVSKPTDERSDVMTS